MPSKSLAFAALASVLLLAGVDGARAQSAEGLPPWPEIEREHRPWTRWWWMGSSVDEQALTAAMETYEAAGLGGLEVTPIYGVAGFEDRFVDYLSPEWMRLLTHALREADRLGLGVDVATGTGWPFGGPWVTSEEAARYVAYRTFTLGGGERLDVPVRYRQEPFVRAVGNQVYELYGGILRPDDEAPAGSRERPLQRPGAEAVSIDDLVEPVAANDDLQALALEQVRFPVDLPLQALVAYAADGDVVDVTDAVDAAGRLGWTAPPGDWTLYAVFQGWHGKMVERAAPGGEGYVIDHFSARSLARYLARFDRAFAGADIDGLRAFFNDSYEVDDARGEADWTPGLFDAFEARRGYDLRRHLPALFGRASDEENLRVRQDYRRTISDLLLDAFTRPWRDWAHARGALVRNQAHGAPGNILDLYAASDIPETEGTDLLRIKFASSAAHLAGRRLTSAESATWLNEHFTSSLADVKRALDRYFVGGVNHVFYHGTNFSPPEEPWPGWLFYAAVHFAPVNPFWEDFRALNAYVARVQSFLQAGRPDEDVLLYFPIFDRYADAGGALLRHFDGAGEDFAATAFNVDAAALLARGYTFDVVSDRLLRTVQAGGAGLEAGDASYRTVVVPGVRYVPLATVEKLFALAEEGATVVVHGPLPADVPGLGALGERRARFAALLGRLAWGEAGTAGVREAVLGAGRFLQGADLEALLRRAAVRREPMVEAGLRFVRRRHADGTTYFVTNTGAEAVDGWVPLAVEAASVAAFDPASGARGMARSRPAAHGTDVYVQIDPGASWILRTYDAARAGTPYVYHHAAGAAQVLDGTWTVRFLRGGPVLPPGADIGAPASWTDFGGEAGRSFSGTARYAVAFARPQGAGDGWLLDLGVVHESARVRLNGHDLGTLLGPSYRLHLDDRLLREDNVLEVDVTNLMANRIAAMDRRKVPWKKFYNVNFPARRAANRNEQGLFDASAWMPRPSGLVGPVTLTPVTHRARD